MQRSSEIFPRTLVYILFDQQICTLSLGGPRRLEHKSTRSSTVSFWSIAGLAVMFSLAPIYTPGREEQREALEFLV